MIVFRVVKNPCVALMHLLKCGKCTYLKSVERKGQNFNTRGPAWLILADFAGSYLSIFPDDFEENNLEPDVVTF